MHQGAIVSNFFDVRMGYLAEIGIHKNVFNANRTTKQDRDFLDRPAKNKCRMVSSRLDVVE
jgi:hypothetical protein